GASALAYRSGGMHRAAQWLSKEGNALSRAYKETRSEQGRLSKNLNKDSFRNTKDSFLKKRKEHLDLHNSSNRFEARNYDIVRHIRQREHLIDNEVPISIRENMRMKEVMDTLKKNHDTTDEVLNNIQKGIAKGRPE